jgi:hypothetical protein
VRLSVKKAAYANLSRATCRKSGGVLGILTDYARSSEPRTGVFQPYRDSILEPVVLTHTLQPLPKVMPRELGRSHKLHRKSGRSPTSLLR